MITFNQKTSQLRDAIYAVRPELRGTNLNSDNFLEATRKLISDNLTLSYRSKQLSINPIQMKYGGLRFESTFSLEGLPENPELLQIKTDGFDAHEHSVILFRVEKNQDGFLNYFNQEQREATFDFATNHFDFEIQESDESSKFFIYLVSSLAVVLGAVYLVKKRIKTSTEL